MAAPIVKWVGGKTRLLPELLSRMPATYGTYYEPFVGGGALFFAATPARAVLGDMNATLIETYRAVTSDLEAILEHLEYHRLAHERPEYYYAVRAWWNEQRDLADGADRAAAFLYLNKTCFNGLWRVNRRGEFNVPRGDYKDPRVYDAAALRAAAAVLRGAKVVIGEYDATVATAVAGDFVYFDPPYDPISRTSSFTAYTKDAFGRAQQEQLAATARALRARGVGVMLSNNDTPLVRELYADFRVDVVQCGRSINSRGDRRGAVNEVVITG